MLFFPFTTTSFNSLLETFGQDYIRTARAKGLSEFQIIRKHAVKNSLNPVVTAISGWFASMLAGAVFVEYIFGFILKFSTNSYLIIEV